MKKNILSAIASLLLFCNSMQAQVTMSVQGGSFEQWTSHQGYSVNVLFFDFPIFEAYSTPENWGYLSYPFNETITYYGFPLTINTTVPVVKALPDTADVPDGNKAVKLQTFMLSDIIDPSVLSLAGDYIDSSLTQRVIPSVLLTGEINVEALLPIVSEFQSDSAGIDISSLDPLSLLPTMLDVDVDQYISGGVAMGDYQPISLSGSYKYQSVTGGDNGAVILIGTRYNDTTHKREIVGGGINLALTDTGVYTPFEVEYQPLSSIIRSQPTLKADTLIVVIVSSANLNMQQGSQLYIDNLSLLMDTSFSTCTDVQNLEVRNIVCDDFPEMALIWNGDGQPDHWEVEYGPQGFELGEGTVVETEDGYFEIYTLELNNTLKPNTWYDFYVRSVCGDDVYGQWDFVHYRTFCARVNSLTVNRDNITIVDGNRLQGYSVSWVDTTDTERWNLSYGIYDPNFPENLGTSVSVDTTYFEFPPLMPDEVYTIAVKVYCGDDNYGEARWESFKTLSLETIEKAGIASLTVTPNPAHGQCEVSVEQPAELKLFSLDGRLLQTAYSDGTPVVMQLPGQGIFLLQATTQGSVTTRKIVNK